MDLVEIGLRASVVVVAALAVSAALRRRSAALRHWVLATGIFSAVLVVPLSIALPAWDLPRDSPAPVRSSAGATDGSSISPGKATDAQAPPARVPVEQLVVALWSIGFGIHATLLLVAFGRLVRLTQRAAPVSDRRWLVLNRELSAGSRARGGVALLATDVPGVPATWGVRRPCVLLPAHCESWSDARIRIVLSHELAHINRADWCIQFAAEMVRAVFWCSPVFWIACTRLRRESEHACDDAVLEAGVAPAEYASHLVEIARTCRPSSPPWATAMPIARPSTLEWRITAMLNNTIVRRRPTRRTMAIVLVALAGITLPIATFRGAAQSAPLPLVGSVYDMSGAVLPQVVLTLEDAAGVKREAATDGSGRFEFEGVVPGRYVLTTSLAGFLSLSQELTLRDARHWERAVTLQVGGLQETVTVREQRPPGAAPAAPASTEPLKIGGNIRAPRKLDHVNPVYPPAMRDAGFEGVVPLDAQIGVEGTVTSVRVISAQVHPELVRSAVDAVRQWRFSPTLLNGVAVEVVMRVAVHFSLPD